ncbi:MAG: hypothetical protein R3Y29_03570 [bacterium]
MQSKSKITKRRYSKYLTIKRIIFDTMSEINKIDFLDKHKCSIICNDDN